MTAFIALGSNLGEPLKQLGLAVRSLERLSKVTARSHLYRTAPVGGPPGQPDYLNAVVALEPADPVPDRLLEALLAIERAQGRERDVKWAARTLDLDLLAFGERVQNNPTLTLPHPRMMTRAFVLVPLCEIAPEWRHPVENRSACEALTTVGSAGVERTSLSW